jgi:cytochrome P450
MSSLTVEEIGRPALAGAVPAAPPTRRSLFASRRARRQRLFAAVPDSAYDDPIQITQGLFGRFAMVNDPAGVRRVLVENVANYPKTPLQQRFFTAIFGAGLLGSDGELWRAHRRIMAPSFDPRSVAAYGPAVTEATTALLARWDAKGPGAITDMVTEMTDVTLRIIAKTMFSTDDDEVLDAINRSLHGGQDVISDINMLDLLPLTREWRMRRREARVTRLFASVDALVARLMAEREADPASAPDDLLTRLIAARDDEGGGRLSPREVRDEVVTIFMAGHETTAMTMSWVWYLLSQHPREFARLGEELDAVLAGRPAGQADLPRLAFTRRVVEESMRLYPAAPGISTRVALEDDVISGQKIPKGMSIAILPWVLHRHRKLWHEPERFDPDRFLPERSLGRPRFAFLPFGAGPRVCIGQVLAMNEAVLILANLARVYQPRLAPGAEVALHAAITLRPKHGLKMVLERRERAPGS